MADETRPLVSILIPTHNRPELFEQALQSVLGQTYQNLEIIISDDSDDERTQQLVKERYADDGRIHYTYNPGFDAQQNWLWGLERFSGEYFNFLMDDDLYYPTKIEYMLAMYKTYPDIALVTSARDVIDLQGSKLAVGSPFSSPWEQDVLVDGAAAARRILSLGQNWIGEPTTVLLKRKCKDDFRDVCMLETPLSDVRMWLKQLKLGNMAYIHTPQSAVRHYAGQDQNTPDIIMRGCLEWVRLLHDYGISEPDASVRQEYYARALGFSGRLHEMYLYANPETRGKTMPYVLEMVGKCKNWPSREKWS